jgi:FtsH-binding integral membrane protein
VALTALVVLAVASSPALLATVASARWIIFFGVLGLGWFAPRLMFSGNTATAHAAYWGYAGLWGLMIAPMMAHYLSVQPDLIFRAFLVTSVTFGATSLAGYVTKRSLTGFGAFFVIASIGLIIAMIVNAIFFASTMASFAISGLVVLLFAAITAWETQQIKDMYVEGDMPAMARSKSIFGAYMLYGSFVTLFTHILNMLGIMSNE